MAKKFNQGDFEGKKHFIVYVTAYGNISYTETLDEAKKEAAKLTKSYPNRLITLYQAVAEVEEQVVPLTWTELA